MDMKHWLSAAVSCLALVLWAMPATAAPISGVTTGSKIAADGSSMVETTHWRRRYAYYFSENSDDDFDRYYPYDEPYYYRYSYVYPSYRDYYAYPRYRYQRYHHYHHRHHRHYHRW